MEEYKHPLNQWIGSREDLHRFTRTPANIYLSYIIGTVHGFRLKSLQKTIDSLIDEGPEGPRNHPNNHLSSQVIDKTNILHGTILVIWH